MSAYYELNEQISKLNEKVQVIIIFAMNMSKLNEKVQVIAINASS